VAKDKGWLNLWIECDSALVIQAFSNPSIVLWKLCKRWEACQFFLCKDIVLVISHIYREGNFCADKLANVDALSRDSCTCWDSIPIFVRNEFLRNRTSLSYYRFH